MIKTYFGHYKTQIIVPDLKYQTYSTKQNKRILAHKRMKVLPSFWRTAPTDFLSFRVVTALSRSCNNNILLRFDHVNVTKQRLLRARQGP